jgi:hypothetical protein
MFEKKIFTGCLKKIVLDVVKAFAGSLSLKVAKNT